MSRYKKSPEEILTALTQRGFATVSSTEVIVAMKTLLAKKAKKKAKKKVAPKTAKVTKIRVVRNKHLTARYSKDLGIVFDVGKPITTPREANKFIAHLYLLADMVRDWGER